jgi:hypothetical protein
LVWVVIRVYYKSGLVHSIINQNYIDEQEISSKSSQDVVKEREQSGEGEQNDSFEILNEIKETYII